MIDSSDPVPGSPVEATHRPQGRPKRPVRQHERHGSRLRAVVSSPWFHLLLACTVTALLLLFVAKPYAVSSESMRPTLGTGDTVLVYRLAYVGATPATGDVVVFDADETWGPHTQESPLKGVLRWIAGATGLGPTGQHTLVKRVIAGPGQSANCCTTDGRVEVDHKPLTEPYVTDDFPFQPGSLDCTTDPRSKRCFAEVVVPDDSYLVLGDNRAASSDSAIACRGGTTADGCWRWANRSGIIGRVLAVVWPIGRWSGL